MFLLEKINKSSNFLNKYNLLNEQRLIKLFNLKKMKFYNKDLKNNTLIEIPSITNFFMLFADIKSDLVRRNLIKSLKKYYKNEKFLYTSIKYNHKLFEEKDTGEDLSG